MSKLTGRQREIKVLDVLLNSKEPEFLAIYGRRRIGKTFLISQFFKEKGLFFEFTGSKDTSEEVLFARFASELSYRFHDGEKKYEFKNWEEGFEALRLSVQHSIHALPDQKIILFFDELPWIVKSSGSFISSLDYYWNRFFSRSEYKNVILIVCGSAASWIIDNIINNKGGLHNRITQIIKLKPFTLGETRAYLQSRNIDLDNKQIVELYMAFGGVPLYLSFIKQNMSAAQAIDSMCFGEDAFLQEEFDRIYSSLFDNYHNHVKIVRALAGINKGTSRTDLLKRAGIPNGGDATTYLKELESSGFISKHTAWKKKKRDALYRLSDEYSLFYIKWIEPMLEKRMAISTSNDWINISNTPKYTSWSGFAFEGVCLKHAENIKRALGISGVLTYASSWSYRPQKHDPQKGVQIDLIFERADRIINLFEIKFVNGLFVMQRRDEEDFKEKKRIFIQKEKIKFPVITTLITTYGVKENRHYFAAVQQSITMDALF